jgi:arsenate reductase (thioredoxin)
MQKYQQDNFSVLKNVIVYATVITRTKVKIILYTGFLLLILGCSDRSDTGQLASFVEPLQPYISQVLAELDIITPERKETLDEISELVSRRLELGGDANLTFICSHNSRRSHMSQLWSQTAAFYYGIENVFSYSGGTEATACNVRTISALRRAGFSVSGDTGEENPVYMITYSEKQSPMIAYSKLYTDPGNPQEGYIALMCCSKADRQCPVVQGASSRFAIHYADPAECDDTSEESEVYDERCREIAREMFYIMSRVVL